ncbi:VanZ family protein [Planomicrobium okeanokoites]|uniref:VanZ family protein n=1 Tax=Planomicrobium okeanokoites TaxID=244 RepID=UPI0024930D2D|nr:VanZ family protein [Planomicrobium okeanokoites]
MRGKYIPVMLWVLCILLATNNYSFQSLLFDREIGINIRLFPNLSDLFIISDINLTSKIYLFQKVGHMISFGILYILLVSAIAGKRKAFIMASLFAFFTEVLQLFFERSGRFADVLIDIMGIYLACRLSVYIEARGGLNSVFWITVQKIVSAFVNEKPR